MSSMAALNFDPQLEAFTAQALSNFKDFYGLDKTTLSSHGTSNLISPTVFGAIYKSDVPKLCRLMLWDVWNIVFSYTTYLNGGIDHDDFMQLAGDLIDSGLAVISHYSEGFLIWKSSEIKVEQFDIDREPYTIPTSAEFTIPEDLSPYQAQCALHALQERFFDLYQISSIAQERMTYIRAFLDPCEVKMERYNLKLYPSVTIHKNGVLQMHFRLISGGTLLTTGEFIDEFINAPMRVASDILLPPALMRLDARKILWEKAQSFGERRRARAELKRVNSLIEEHTQLVENGPDSFDHMLVTINPEGRTDSVKVSLTLLTAMLGNALETLLNRPRSGWKYQLLGPGRSKYLQGKFWSGRPTVYVLPMKDHADLAPTIAEKYATELGYLMMRSTHMPPQVAQKALGESLRLGDDYLAYTGEALNLYVYSKRGLEAHSGHDPNGNELIYRLQSQVDFSDFVAGSLWKCEEHALLYASTVEELINNREEQTFYDHISQNPFVYGELNRWFAEVQKQRGMDATRAAIAFNTTLKLEKFKEARNFGRQQFQWLMAGLLGLIAAGSSGSKLVALAWEGLGRSPLSESMYVLMAILTVFLLIVVFYRLFVVSPRSR